MGLLSRSVSRLHYKLFFTFEIKLDCIWRMRAGIGLCCCFAPYPLFLLLTAPRGQVSSCIVMGLYILISYNSQVGKQLLSIRSVNLFGFSWAYNQHCLILNLQWAGQFLRQLMPEIPVCVCGFLFSSSLDETMLSVYEGRILVEF